MIVSPSSLTLPLKKCRIILIRHAQSLYNAALNDFRKKNQVKYVWEQLAKHEEFLYGLKYNYKFVDTDITQTGIKQCMQARQHIKSNEIIPDIILVSPLLRTLKTCNLIFEQYKNIEIRCQPLLSETFRSAMDIPIETQRKVQIFPHVNFDSVVQEGPEWFIKNQSAQNQYKYFSNISSLKNGPNIQENQDLQSIYRHQNLQPLSQSISPSSLSSASSTSPHISYESKIKQILKTMSQNTLYQLPKNVRQRCIKIKQMIYTKYYNKGYKNIAVVTHHGIIRYLIANKFDQKLHQPIDQIQQIKNCHILEKQFSQMMRFN